MRTQLVAVFLLFAISAVAARGTVGFPSVDRAHLDSWRDAIYIPNPRSKLTAGFIESFELYAKRPGEIVLQVWRLVSGSYYKLIAQKGHHVVKAGKQEVFLSQPVRVNAGDIIGFYFPAHSIIPFDGHESCWHDRGLYVKSPKRAHVVVGKTFYFHAMRSGWNPCRQYSFSAKVIRGVPTTEGFPATKDRKYLDSWRNAIYIPHPHKPLPKGFLTAYNFYARRLGKISLQVWRRVSGSIFELVHQEWHKVTSTGMNTVHPKKFVSIKKGDFLGFYFPYNSIIPFDGRECYHARGLYVHYPSSSSVTVGRRFYFRNMQRGWNPCREYSFNADVVKTE